MATVTLSIPEDIRNKMKEHDDVNWSAFIRKQIEEKTREIEAVKKLQQQLKAESEQDAWAVKLQRANRSGRLAELKAKGLI